MNPSKVISSSVGKKLKGKVVSSTLKQKMEKDHKNRVVSLFASSIVHAVDEEDSEDKEETPVNSDEEQKSESKVATMDADKQAYFISLALRDIKNILEVANFNLKGALKKQKPVVTDIYFSRDGSASVDVTIPFVYNSEQEEEDFSNITGAFDMELRSEYKELVEYKVVTPTVSHPDVSIDLTITLPPALVKSLGVGKYDTRTKTLAKYAESLIKKELA